jgi:membrane protein YdbS with pleckstrin-like domain
LQEKSFPYRKFAVREKDVIYEKGWILRTTTICPFNRIQNCSVQSGPWERKFKLASLLVYTAGTQGADVRIPGLQQDEAEQLRHFILDKIHAEVNDTV